MNPDSAPIRPDAAPEPALVVYGLSHHTAAVEVRERAAPHYADSARATARLAEAPGVEGALLLSTCNRLEIWLAGRPDAGQLAALLPRAAGHPVEIAPEHFYEYRGRAALRHIFRVCASLDSRWVGEPQILGQVKQAYQASHQAGLMHPELESALQRAFSVAKRLRGDPELVGASVSLGHAAVDLAGGIFGSLRDKTVLLLGAGKMGQLAARYLRHQGAHRLLIANRTRVRAQVLAQELEGESLAWEEVSRRAPEADIVLACSRADGFILDRARMASVLHARRQRPMLLLDLSLPRILDPSIHSLENAFLYNVDDLKIELDRHHKLRQRAAARAEVQADVEVEKYLRRLQLRDLTPTLLALQAKAESLRRRELQRLRARLGGLTPEQEQALEELTQGLMRKWLHAPMAGLRHAAADGQGAGLIEMAERLFDLTPDARANEVIPDVES